MNNISAKEILAAAEDYLKRHNRDTLEGRDVYDMLDLPMWKQQHKRDEEP